MIRCDNTCFIFGAAPEAEADVFRPGEGCLIIAADKGLILAEKSGFCPDMAVGDFDSLGYVPDVKEIVRHPSVKNDTDVQLAYKEGIRRGYGKFVLFGAIGGRLDHSYANLQLIAGLSADGVLSFICEKDHVVCALTDGSISFGTGTEGIISVFSHRDISEGVSESGLKYRLCDHPMKNSGTLGVSNEFTGEKSEISVKNGTIVVMFEKRNADKLICARTRETAFKPV